MDTKTVERLIETASECRKNAYCPYSKYSVGAAVLTKNGNIFSGCNIENAGLSATVCAERNAIFKAVSEGERKFQAVAIVSGTQGKKPKDYPSPCGICRQVMAEFCNPDKFIVILAKNEKDFLVYTLSELLPLSFWPDKLKSN